MKILAKTITGREWAYNPSTARRVSAASAEKIKEVLNRVKYELKDGEVWFAYDVAEWECAGIYAQDRKFTIRKGLVKEVCG